MTRFQQLEKAFIVVAIGLISVGASPTPYELPIAGLPTERETWRRLDTKHFRLISSASAAHTRRIADQVEGLHAAISEVTHFEPISPVPTLIYIFSDDASLSPYKHLYKGQPASMSGAVYSRPYGDYIAMNGGRKVEATVTVFHEYLHVILRNNLPGIPLWLEEGLAEFFSTFRTVDGEGRLGRPVPWHAHALRQGERIPIERILAAGVSSETYNRFEHQGEFYARSWELVHYLLIGHPQRRRQTMEFLTLGFQGVSQDQAFTKAFGMTYAALESELEAYRKKGYPSRRLRLPATKAPTRKTETLDYPEVLFHLGELLTSQGDREGDAAFHFEQALVRQPTLGRAVTGLGLLAQQDGDLPRARALFQRATTLEEDARSHYLYGSSLLAFGRAVGKSKIAEATRHLERSVALDTSFAPAWASLTVARRLSRARGEKPPPDTYPQDPVVALKVLMLHSRARNREAARALWLNVFETRAMTAEKRAARQILERLDWLAAAGDAPQDLVTDSGLPAPATKDPAQR